ncbi:MAG: deoxyribodipyrimidine photo-lyase [Bacteroidetes bacterium]|nr:deoxyribodipyrimidine photo-lyase [Bacteroidota bacterium]MCY4204761.1 deoxyribodipyrimidine photo-lyase [Bacteroidota bacterium]
MAANIRGSYEGSILWLRRDLRLIDQPAWHVAQESSGPIWPVFILDPLIESTYGAAPKWRLQESLRELGDRLKQQNSRLLLRRGDALEILRSLIRETGAKHIVWSRLYDAQSITRDDRIRIALNNEGITVREVNSSLLFEPWTVMTQTGSFYRVYTPFWKAVKQRDVAVPLPAPTSLRPPRLWPDSDLLSDWKLGAGMNRGSAVVARYAGVGEQASYQRLEQFIENSIDQYKSQRDFPGRESTSRLSENLTYGEISPRVIWHAGLNAIREVRDVKEAEHFLKELIWREFAYHLLYHTPHIINENWRSEWDHFPWREDNEDAEIWRRGMTGIEMIDAAMREMYVTGTMHNRTRMLVASFLTKHLMTGWKVGEKWFRECLIDWDIAANSMGWQWTAGSGPDAAPYFRIYNPEIQAKKFDPDHSYRDRFIAEGRLIPHLDALSYFEAIPRSWNLSPAQAYPAPVIDLSVGRNRALDAYGKL